MARLLFVLVAVFLHYAQAAPHHHIYKTVYVGADGDGISHAQGGAEAGLSFSASVGSGVGGHAAVEKHEIVQPQPELKAEKTVIERTVIPQYAEKTIKVPSYVEKTIRVPTYVDKTIKVPIEPRIVEKQISHEQIPVGNVKVAKALTTPESPYLESRGGYGGVGTSVVVGSEYGHRHGGGFFDGIFNIPIQTLGAVNGFLNQLSGGGGAGAHVRVSKGYGVY